MRNVLSWPNSEISEGLPSRPRQAATGREAPVGGEFVFRLESVCKTAHDNAPPKHIGEKQHARAVGMMRRRVAPVWCR